MLWAMPLVLKVLQFKNQSAIMMTERGDQMIAKLSHIIANFFISQKVVPEEQREVYEYGFELSISSVIGILIVLAIGLVSGRFWESVVFYIVFCFTRLFTGEYHASTYLRCKLTFAGLLLAVLLADWLLKEIESYYWFILHFYSLVVVCGLAPIENPNKELTERQKVKCKVISIVAMAVWLAVMFLFGYLNSELDHIVALTLFCVANLMLLGKNNGRRTLK